ncbi:subtilisin-like protein [Auricularia subglabra TFB-10046 SS5]|nr:subtilisin-like protein [Auricularia subglabra TFB-10046 SS5]
MLTIAALPVLLAFFGFAYAGPVPATRMILHEKRSAPGARFVQSGIARSDEVLNLRIALKNGDMGGLETALLEAATPGRPKFRRWLSKAQVEAYARPSDESLRAVTNWLNKNGLNATSLTGSSDWMSISVPVSTANKMLNTTFARFVHTETGTQLVRTLEYSLPEAVAPHIRLVHPTTSFNSPLRPGPQILPVIPETQDLSARRVADAACGQLANPSCLAQLYNLPIRVSNPQSSSRIVVSGYSNQFANQADLQTFLTQFRPDMSPNTTFSFASLDGGQNSQDPASAGLEANLDIQYAVAVGGGLPTIFLSVGSDVQQGDPLGFLDTANLLLAQDDPPQTFTTSYGVPHEQDISSSLSFAICDAYQQLTARGVSILFASGDGGVAAAPDTQCDGEKFVASWPACPWVTMVGATRSVNPEQGADLSAGGFSYIFDAPSYQTGAVTGYLNQIGSNFTGLFNPRGRAYPDVAAQGERVAIFQSGRLEGIGGTSASSPMFAGIVALLNDELIAAGQPVLGFLNPWMYANPQMFNDIVGGSNPGCGTEGFQALQGWDPVTGLGTPNYPLMRSAAGLSRSTLVAAGLQALLSAAS